MLHKMLLQSAVIMLTACTGPAVKTEAGAKDLPPVVKAAPAVIGSISLPPGFKRTGATTVSFAAYLRSLPLKKDKTVHLYNGSLKANQSAQYAVIDMSVGDKDLQQCADAVMRLRAEYFYGLGKYNAIEFFTGERRKLNYADWLKGKQSTRAAFMNYLTYVFNWCGTASLPYSVIHKPISKMQAGDIFLKPGSPGHAVIVADMAENAAGQKVYLLAQSYMPAQDIHVLKNPADKNISPWYALNNNEVIDTPEWTFYRDQLYGWK